MEKQNFQESEMSTVLMSNQFDAREDARKEPPTAAEIQEWIASYLAEILELDPNDIDTRIPFDRYGLDSSIAIGMTGDLEDWLGYELDPTLVYDYTTVEALARHLVEEFKVKV